MQIKHLLLCTTTLLDIYYVHGHCIDIHSRIVSQGLHYVPGGTNPCTLCICDKGGPKWCKSVLCSPPQNCKSFQVGSSCCEFKCLDDILSGHENYKETYDVALRFIASTVTAILSISLLFFLYNRLKRNKSLAHHNHQHEEQRNLSNVGYIAGNFGYNPHNMGYLGSGNNEIEIRYEETSTNFSLWKPPGNYFPPGEAPPPYEEAMRSAQHDITTQNIHNATTHNTLINSFSSAYPQEINPALICRHDEQPPPPLPSAAIPIATTNEIPNISSNTHQYVNVRVQVQQKHEPRPPAQQPEASYENIAAIKSCVASVSERATSSGFNFSKAYHKGRSRAAIVATPTTVIAADVNNLQPVQSNAYNRYVNDGYNKIKLSDQYNIRSESKKSVHRTLPKNLRELLSNPEGFKIGNTIVSSTAASNDTPRITFTGSTAKIDGVPLSLPPLPPPQHVLPVIEIQEKAKEPKNLLTYQSLSQDEEDYRSECENCKSVVAVAGDDDGEAMNETMSLQRRPLSESGYELTYRTSLTLPTNSRKQRTYPCSTNTREKWFTSMQQSSSEESD